MSVLNQITYVHTTKYYEKGIANDGPFYKVEYFIAEWSKSDRFVNSLLGIGTGAPHRHPLSPNVICVEARCVQGLGKPVLNSNGLPDYAGGALIAAVYKNPSAAFGGATTDLSQDDPYLLHQIDPDTPLVWCTQELDFEVHPISIPDSFYKWADDPDTKKCNVQFTVDDHITVLNLTFHRRTFLPMTEVRRLRGRINNDTFLGAPAECVRFMGGKTRREYSTDGTLSQQVSLVFHEREVSWNMFLRPQTMTWQYVQAPGTFLDPVRRYKLANLMPLVQI
jgi:hypothetical protein